MGGKKGGIRSMRAKPIKGFEEYYDEEFARMEDTENNAVFDRSKYDFPNGYGASIISGMYAYTDKEHPYELAVLKGGEICYETEITYDVIGYLDEEKAAEILGKIRSL